MQKRMEGRKSEFRKPMAMQGLRQGLPAPPIGERTMPQVQIHRLSTGGLRMKPEKDEREKLDKKTVMKARPYLEGYLTGLLRAIEIVQRRDVHPQTLRWLIGERDKTLEEMGGYDD